MSGTKREERVKSAQAVSQSIDEGIGMLTAIFDQRADQFQQRLPSHVTLESFRDAFVQAVQRMPALLEADRSSLFLALQKCADAGLKPDGEEAVITIFGADADDATAQAMQVAKGKRAVFMPMVWGLTKLIRQAGGVKSVSAELIYRGEVAKIILGDTPEFIHERSLDPDFDYSHSNVIGAYAIVRYLDGGIEREWMNRGELARVAAVNPAKKGPRAKWPDQMDRKAPLRRLIKKLPKSKEDRRFEYAMAADDTAEHDIDGTAEEMLPPRTALSPPRDTAKPPQDVPKGDPVDESLGQRVDTGQSVKGAEAAKGGQPVAGQGTGGQPAAGAQDPIKSLFYAADEAGEPVMTDGGEMRVFTTAMAFIAWLEAAAMHSKTPETLWQANIDTIEEACQDPEVKARADNTKAGIDNYIKTRDAPPASDAAAAAAGQPEPPKPLPAPMKPGAAGWQGYLAECERELAGCVDDTAITAWVSRNFGTYHGKAIEISIEKRIGARRAAARGAVQDQDAAQAARMVEEIKAAGHMNTLNSWGAAMINITLMNRWADQRPDLWKLVNDATKVRMSELERKP